MPKNRVGNRTRRVNRHRAPRRRRGYRECPRHRRCHLRPHPRKDQGPPPRSRPRQTASPRRPPPRPRRGRNPQARGGAVKVPNWRDARSMPRAATSTPKAPTGEVVGRWVDAAPDAGQTALVGRIAVGRPLNVEGHTRAILKHQELILDHGEDPHATGKKRIGDGGQNLCRGAGKSTVPTHVSSKGRRHETRPLIGPPLFGENPSDLSLIPDGVDDRIRSLPGPDLDLAFIPSRRQRISGLDDLDVTGHEGKASWMVVGEDRVAPLPQASHVPDGGNRPDVVVVPLVGPRRDGRVMQGASERVR